MRVHCTSMCTTVQCCTVCMYFCRMKTNSGLVKQRYSLGLVRYVGVVGLYLCTFCVCACVLMIWYLLGGLYGEATFRQTQLQRHHDSKNDQGMDCMAEVPAPTQDHHLITGPYQRPAS